MARINKRYDERGKLAWAQGAARDIYKDAKLQNSKGVYFKISGETSRWFRHMLPRHMATWETEGPPSSARLEEVYSNVPPFNEWRFVLLAFSGPNENYVSLAHEISGDQLLEVAISATGEPTIES